jgi:hypothetical protein
MSDIFGGNSDGGVSKDYVDSANLAQDIIIDSFTSAAVGDLEVRVGDLETSVSALDSSISILETDVLNRVLISTYNTDKNTQNNTNITLQNNIDNKVNTTTYTTFVNNQGIINSTFQNDISARITTTTANATFATISSLSSYYLNSNPSNFINSTALTPYLLTTTFNNSIMNYYNKTESDNRYVQITNLPAVVDLSPYRKAADEDVINATFLTSSNASSIYQTITNMNNYSTTVQMNAAINAYVPSLNSTQISSAAITGVSGNNVFQQLSSLKTLIDGIVVSGTGFNTDITNFINSMNTSYLGNTLIYNAITSSSLRAKFWFDLSKINQNLNTDNTSGVSFRKCTLVGGSGILNTISSDIFRILGNLNGNNDSTAIMIDSVGQFFSRGRETIGGPTIEYYEISNLGRVFKMRPGATIGVYNGTQKLLEDLLTEEQTIWNAIGSNLSNLSTINQNLNTAASPSFYQMSIGNGIIGAGTALQLFDTNLGIPRGQISNTGRFISIASNGSVAVEMSDSVGLRVFGQGNMSSEPFPSIQINRPLDTAIASRLFNDGSIKLFGSNRSNVNAESVLIDNIGNVNIQGNITCNNVISNGDVIYNPYNMVKGSWDLSKNLTDLSDFGFSQSIVIGHFQTINQFNPLISQKNRFIAIGNYNTITEIKRDSLIMGNSNTVSTDFFGNTGRQTILGSNNTLISAEDDIIIGHNNSLSYLTTNDQNRICIGNNNTTNGESISIGFNNNIQATNSLGALSKTFILGNNWNTINAQNTLTQVPSNTVCLGDPSLSENVRLVMANSFPIYTGTSATAIIMTLDTGINHPTHTFMRSVSARRYKENIESVSFPIEDFKKLKACKYNIIGGDKLQYGLIAEEVDEIPSMKPFVQKNGKGECEDIDYRTMTAMLINIVQKLNDRIEKLEAIE